MGLRFNMLLADAGIDPADVRLLRHQTTGTMGKLPTASGATTERPSGDTKARRPALRGCGSGAAVTVAAIRQLSGSNVAGRPFCALFVQVGNWGASCARGL